MKLSILSAGLVLATGIGMAVSVATPVRADGADDTFFYGKWKITEAQEAPWVVAGETVDSTESENLIGKTIELSAKGIAGPGSFPCKNPQYQVIDGGPDILFQGSFGEMQSHDPNVKAEKLAEQMGLTGDKFRTVVTGCEYEVDFSFGSDEDTAKFGLNDYIYTLKRE
jgi:hypothetical protein